MAAPLREAGGGGGAAARRRPGARSSSSTTTPEMVAPAARGRTGAARRDPGRSATPRPCRCPTPAPTPIASPSACATSPTSRGPGRGAAGAEARRPVPVPGVLQADTRGAAPLYDAYSFKVIPRDRRGGGGDRDAYQYLVESIRRFPDQQRAARTDERGGLSPGVGRPTSRGGVVRPAPGPSSSSRKAGWSTSRRTRSTSSIRPSTVLSANHDIKCMFTTPKLLDALVRPAGERRHLARRRAASPASSAAAPK